MSLIIDFRAAVTFSCQLSVCILAMITAVFAGTAEAARIGCSSTKQAGTLYWQNGANSYNIIEQKGHVVIKDSRIA